MHYLLVMSLSGYSIYKWTYKTSEFRAKAKLVGSSWADRMIDIRIRNNQR